MSVQPWVRTVYLYLFALVGLGLFTTGAVQLLDMGLRAAIFTQADSEERMRSVPPMPFGGRPIRFQEADTTAITAQERALLRDWAVEYERWKEQVARIDPVRARREREAARSLAMILIGLPLYLFHWRIIRREGA